MVYGQAEKRINHGQRNQKNQAKEKGWEEKMTIFQINIFLLCLISALAIFHRGAGRMAALTYAILMVLQSISCDALEGYRFFVGCAIFETAILIVLCSFSKISRLSDILITVACFSWITSAMGALLWHYSIPLELYYYACTTLYVIAATTMLWEDGTHDQGRDAVSCIFRGIRYPGMVIRRTIHRAAAQ